MDRTELKEMEAELKEIDQQINNIITAISNGFYQEVMRYGQTYTNKKIVELFNYDPSSPMKSKTILENIVWSFYIFKIAI